MDISVVKCRNCKHNQARVPDRYFKRFISKTFQQISTKTDTGGYTECGRPKSILFGVVLKLPALKDCQKKNLVFVYEKNNRKITFPEIQNCQVKDFPASSILNKLSEKQLINICSAT